jgi:4-carboxymuconolactone decarboxylase
LAHNSHVLRNFLRLGNSLLTRSKLSPKLRELAILRIAQITNSEYEWTQHYPIALEVGVSQTQTEAISHWNDSIHFNSEEKAVLQYTDEVEQSVEVKDETFQALIQHLSEQSIVELTLSIGYWGMVARLLVPLQVDIDTQSISSAQELMGHRS